MCLHTLPRLSLIEDNVSEREEPDIEDYESDSSYSLVKTIKVEMLVIPVTDKLHMNLHQMCCYYN